MECFLVVSDILHSIRVLCNGFEKKVIIAEIFETKVLTGECIVVIITITFETKASQRLGKLPMQGQRRRHKQGSNRSRWSEIKERRFSL